MSRALLVLMFASACLRPSKTKTTGYAIGGAMTAGGAGLVAFELMRDCSSDEGLFNGCELGVASGIALGATLAAFGLVKLGIELATDSPPAPAH